jgi:peptidoglycan pentaglycine glycine transferase (the first glycine)
MRFYNNKSTSIWDDFIVSNGPKQTEFLQSYIWGEIMKKENKQVFRLYGVSQEEETWLSASSLYSQKLFSSLNYWYCPRGPVINRKACDRLNCQKLEVWRLVLKSWQREAKLAKIPFIRFEPNYLEPDDFDIIERAAKSLNLRLKRTSSIQPKKTWLTDLSLGEEKIKEEMKAKTRYNIRLAKKKDLTVSFSKDKFEEFWQLLEKTGQRDGFRLHNKEHYAKILEAGGEDVQLISVSDQEELLAAGIFAFYGKKIVYLHGASNYLKRNKMAPYLLHWTIIQTGLKQAYRYYDWHGVDDYKWPGVSRFKKGFGGFELDYPCAYDLVVSSNYYNIYKYLKKLKKTIYDNLYKKFN